MLNKIKNLFKDKKQSTETQNETESVVVYASQDDVKEVLETEEGCIVCFSTKDKEITNKYNYYAKIKISIIEEDN